MIITVIETSLILLLLITVLEKIRKGVYAKKIGKINPALTHSLSLYLSLSLSPPLSLSPSLFLSLSLSFSLSLSIYLSLSLSLSVFIFVCQVIFHNSSEIPSLQSLQESPELRIKF